jgi:hypothetical protein
VTTPAGVPNLPVGALTVETLAEQLQDQTAEAMRARAGERVPTIFNSSTGGDILNNLSPFGIITGIWAGINSLIATSDPSDIQGPEDIPPLLLDFVEGLPLIGQFVQLLEALIGTYDGTDETLLSIQELLSPIIEFFSGLIDEFGNLADWAISLASGGLSAVMEAVEAFFTSIPNLSTWLATFKTFIDGLLSIGNLSTFLDTFKTLINGLGGITNFSNWVAVFKSAIDTFVGLFGSLGSTVWTVLGSAITTLATLFGSLGSGVWTVITEIIEFFDGVFSGAGSIGTWLGDIPGNLLSVIGTITGFAVDSIEDGIAKLTQFTQSLPNTGSLIAGLMGSKVNPATGTNNTLPDLIWWGSQLLLSTSVIPSFNLTGFIPAELLALIGVGQIGDVTPNLVTDAGFGSAAAFQAGVGWSWDSGLNSTGSTGGAAKLLCDGGVKYLFSNLVAAAPAQQLTVSVKARYTKGSSAQANIICGVRTYTDTTVKSTDTVVSLTATGTTSVGISGADAAGFKTLTGTFTVPANATHVRLVLGVTTGTSGTVVWFDEASMTKTSKLSQDLVQNLGNTIEALLPVDEYKKLLNGVAATTGATVQQVIDVIGGKLAPGDDLDGAWIKAGDISSEFISELVETWTRLGGSVSGATGTAPTTVAGAAAEFSSLVSNINSLVSLVGGNIGDIFRLGQTVGGHTSLISGIDTKLGTYSSDIKKQLDGLILQDNTAGKERAAMLKRIEVLEKTPTVPIVPPPSTVVPIVIPPITTPVPPTTTTPTPPVLVSASDDFERTALGSAWTLTPFTSNGSNIGILSAHDAYMSVPGVSNTQNRIAAIYAGSGSVSSGDYQKIWATLGSKAGIPALGSQGFNDLIGRAASATTCMFARFYPDGRVHFGYRQGTWTDQIFGTFTAPKALTSATPIEFYCGDKTVNDQTKVYAKVGTAVIGPSYMNTAVLATMGRGWGFGMGHGLSDVTFTFGNGVPQVPGTLNFWAAQEQA